MAGHWCKVASNLDTNPKIRKAGHLGREVFLFALRRNAEPSNATPGQIPAEELEPEFVSDMLMVTRDDAVTGVTAACNAGLLVREGDFFTIAPWKEGWGKGGGSNAERQKRYRENKRVQSVTLRNDNTQSRNVTGNARDTDQSRSEKTKKSVAISAGDRALAAILILKVIKNNPRSTLAKQTESEQEATIVKWADSFRLMREQDGHTEADIKTVIEWCTADNFWRSNIQSAATLRKQWNTLTGQMERLPPSSAQTKAPKHGQPTFTFAVGDTEVDQ